MPGHGVGHTLTAAAVDEAAAELAEPLLLRRIGEESRQHLDALCRVDSQPVQASDAGHRTQRDDTVVGDHLVVGHADERAGSLEAQQLPGGRAGGAHDDVGGGDLARELDRLYSYINTRLLDVALKREAAALDEVQKLLTTLRDGWSQVVTTPGVTR